MQRLTLSSGLKLTYAAVPQSELPCSDPKLTCSWQLPAHCDPCRRPTQHLGQTTSDAQAACLCLQQFPEPLSTTTL